MNETKQVDPRLLTIDRRLIDSNQDSTKRVYIDT